jgi:predicted DsbA family dithiol-disulfide isomerase
MAEAQELDITGTPTFLFGTLGADGRLTVVRRESGAIPTRAFAALLDALLDQ